VAVTADVALSDCFQADAPPLYAHIVVNDEIVGVVPFVFVATQGTPLANPKRHPVNNITSEQVKDVFVEGNLTLSELSGNSADTEPVLAVGRDEDSGERVQALVNSGIGNYTYYTFLQQYQPLYNGNRTPTNPPPAPPIGSQITGAALWPTLTLNAISYPLGDSGYSGGGSLAAAISVSHGNPPSPTFATWFVSYFGVNDATYLMTFLSFNAVQLQFNGIPYTAANVEGPGAPGFSAQYTYWGYEHVFYRTTYAGYGKTVADQIATHLTTTSASVSGILLGNMKVHREEDGRTRDGEPIVPGPL